jgi:Dolichyl-phosphate-mannose-protein mannosyltransferase
MTSRLASVPRPVMFVLLVAAGLAAVVRLVAVLPGPLTPGDGGLIVVMVDDLRNAGFVMPLVTTYNMSDIPFVYPPLGIYGTALLSEVFRLSSLDGVRVGAGLLSLATVGAFALLALRLLPPVAAAGAVFMYALMPHAYDPVVAGGGVTRGSGVLLAMLAMWVAATPTGVTTRRAVGIGILLGLAALSHPQTALYGAAASTVLVYRPGDVTGTVRRVVTMGVVSFLVVVPWLVVVSGMHGLTAVLAPGYRWDPALGIIRLLGLTFSGSGFTDLFLVIGALGLAVELLRRRWRLPLLLACLIFAGEADFIGAVPWSLLGGAAFAFVLAGIGPLVAPRDRAVRVAVGLVVVFAALVSSIGSVVDDTSRLQRVSDDQAAAMAWVRDDTEPEVRFIVATVVGWGGDEISEWFPAVAERQSVATVQGSEWLGRDGFRAQRQRHRDVVFCTPSTDRCMAEWAASEGLADAWLFIPKGRVNGPLSPDDCCPAIRELVQDSAFYEVVYDGAGATIARPRD